MEMLGRLLTMMFNIKTYKSFTILALVILLGCSKNDEEIAKHCGINGTIDVGTTYWSHPNGFKITIKDVADSSVKHVAVSDANGNFEFRDIEAGTYSINAEKEDYRWVWMFDDGVVNYRNKLIELNNDHIKDIKILMNYDSPYYSDSSLDITDVFGNPIGDYIEVPKYTTTIAIRLYNGTDQSQYWSVQNIDRCIVFDEQGMDYEYTFSSFSATSGTLAPGDNVVLVGIINQRIYDIRTSSQLPWFNELRIDSKSICLNIEF